ncbi:MAG: hypothetical protein LAN64_10220 [Acidobacteriia bacterium]|nr:hypothetical protein [Terriglobia bacterium]
MPVALLSILVSLLPRRYRGYELGDGNLDVRRGAIFSSSLQFVLCCAALWARYPAFLRARLAEAAAVTGATAGSDRVVAGLTDFSAGAFAVFQYMFSPITLLILYFALEGAVRIFAVVASDEVLPTLPLQLVAWALEVGKVEYQEHELGPRLADVVEPGLPGKYDLKVLSCRPKEWNHLVTIRFNDQMYEVQSEQTGLPPWRFVYLLRLKPESKIVRSLQDYDPEEPRYQPGWAEVHESPRN